MNIMKSFNFCYAHRVWNQVLTNNILCRCRYNHGHTSSVDLVLTAPSLIRGMIIDFNELKFIKEFIDTVIDHHTLCDVNDPLVIHYLTMLHCGMEDLKSFDGYQKISTCKLAVLPDHLREFGESFVFIEDVPSSEFLVSWLSQVIQTQLFKNTLCKERDVRLVSLKWWESETSYAEWVA